MDALYQRRWTQKKLLPANKKYIHPKSRGCCRHGSSRDDTVIQYCKRNSISGQNEYQRDDKPGCTSTRSDRKMKINCSWIWGPHVSRSTQSCYRFVHFTEPERCFVHIKHSIRLKHALVKLCVKVLSITARYSVVTPFLALLILCAIRGRSSRKRPI